jgi:hypothetical protein
MNSELGQRSALRVLVGCLVAMMLVFAAGCGASSPGGKSEEKVVESGSPTPSQDSTDTPAPDESSSPTNEWNLPECSTVWITGQVLPEEFMGCAENGQFVEPDIMYCESGQSLATYQNRYYAALGQVINEVPNVRKSRVWRKMLRACTA